MAARLRSEGYEVEIAGDGPGGVELCERFRPDLVVLDLMLPGLDGIEVCKQIQREHPLPVLMLTARATARPTCSSGSRSAPTTYTQLSIVHTHLLTLGFIVLLIVLILEKLFTLSASACSTGSSGQPMVITAAIVVWHGILQVNGTAEVSGAIPGIAGVGHILLSAGMVLLFLALRTRLFGAEQQRRQERRRVPGCACRLSPTAGIRRGIHQGEGDNLGLRRTPGELMARKNVEKAGREPGNNGRKAGTPNPAVGLAAAAAFDDKGRPRPAVQNLLLQAVEVQRPHWFWRICAG